MATIPVTAALILAGLLYMRGWLRVRGAIASWRAASFLTGLFSLWLAAASPLAMLDEHLLTAHMIQHLLLMTIGPACILLGFPALALQIPQRCHRLMPSPWFCWCASSSVLIGWHIPAVFGATFHSMPLHAVEHASFVVAGLLFWQPVIPSRPGPYHAQWSIVLYLFMATVPCDILSAFLAFCGGVVYPAYLNMPPHFGMSALEDQQCAGALMWTVVTFAYMIPAMLATMALLSDGSSQRSAEAERSVLLSHRDQPATRGL
jgi:putative membrane protein